MKKLQILMPMAGLGSRFAKAGFELPKPLIEVDGRAMFLKALESLSDIQAEKSYHFVIRELHVAQQHLDELIHHALPEAQITILPEMTQGAAETALAARDSLSLADGLVVMDCDLWFKSQSYNQMVSDSLAGHSPIAGGLITFEASDPRYSYAELNGANMVVRTAEKQVISSHAITGAYFFATGAHFVRAAAKLMEKPITPEMPEYYMSLLYNELLDEGEKIQAAFVDEYYSFGTPEELADYQASKSL